MQAAVQAAAPGRRPPVSLRGQAVPVLDVVIPVCNEERDIESCVRRLHTHLGEYCAHTFTITIADNASTDATWAIARRLCAELPEVRAVHLDEKGRGHALRRVWLDSPSPVLAYMDVDLSTDLAALGPLIAPLLSGHSDIAIGTRLDHNSRVVRGPQRELISRCYNLLLRGSLGAHFSDAQCGFKAIRRDVAEQLLPYTLDNSWFFDTELLVLAERSGLRVAEIPVDWTDDPNSSVDVIRTAADDIRGIIRISRDMFTGRVPVAELRAALGRGKLPGHAGTGTSGTGNTEPSGRNLFGQLVRFGAVGGFCTVAYLVLFLLCRTVMDAQLANFLAMLVTAVANTAGNRMFTFGVHGSLGLARHHFQGLIVFAIGLGLTSLALYLLQSPALTQGGAPSRTMEVAAVVGANLLATLVRFLLFRLWVFRPSAGPTAQPATGAGAGSAAIPVTHPSPVPPVSGRVD